jgi:hypothetical protein
VPYDPRIVGPDTDQDAPDARVARRRPARPVPPGPWLTLLAFAVVAVPFGYALVRLATAPAAHLTLPDDLALIDLHVRRALAWKQQLGVFDHNNWNHPGPTYFYLQSVAYRLFGSSARSLFLGATLLNGLAAVTCVGVVRRRTTPARALWAAVWVTVLAAVLAAAGPSATTYSESVLGALVSPWNPTVVLVPLLLLVLLCAGAVDRSGASLVGALVVGSFVVQTDISTGPLTVALVGVAVVVWVVTAVRDRRARAVADGAVVVPDPDATSGRWRVVLVVGGLVVVVLQWFPPIVQQLTDHPGNMTLIARFFGAAHPGQPLSVALWAVAAAAGVLVVGPAEVMPSILGGTPAHAGWAVAVSVATVVLAAVVAVLGFRQRSRFACGLGALTLVGCLSAVVAVTHVVGFVYGYLVLWAVVLPVAALIAVGTVRVPLARAAAGLRIALCVVAVAVAAVACARVAAIPPLARAGDPRVAALVALVTPHLPPGTRVAVGDAGAGSSHTRLPDAEEFIGLVDALDRAGDRPTVNAFWKAQFGPGYLSDGTEPRRIGLSTWTPDSAAQPGYVGRIGDMAVVVVDRSGGPVPARG